MPTENALTITGVQIPMGSLVVLFIKMGVAAIPAAILLAVVVAFVAAMVGGYVALLT